MTAEERAEIVVTARLLEAAGRIDWLSTGLTLIAAVSLHGLTAATAILLGVVAKFYSVRIAFDARLFADVAAETLTMSDLDAAFRKKSGRSWPERCRGARRLVVVCAIVTAAQCVVMLA